ncbi:hypothetical protein BGW36DRAFT_308338 [Talaromyces proteolyticus]|uniref:Uncharacterized protein n=1 Tax=Talaromyces proteolyticus TaxID=1131652 RepID=A0AAD4KEW2_9EURO|nr:uncharacterized protein BGW36DRAFT_308338 [Talaromyces proteolyticus]KAH8689290.1 hypothetical protein BGW36DRAFT_308338 [Talaromyces proteolyticus]
MELMEKKYEENGAAGVRDLQRWPMHSDAVEFLAVTTSASSVDELIKQPLIQKHQNSRKTLIGIARFAMVTTTTFYSYP